MKIVIVEDESVTRQWLCNQIGKLKLRCHVETFSNGRQALDYLSDQETDVLLTDIRMPVMDGLELLREMKKRKDGAYKVILSAYDEFHCVRQAMRLGANEFILKSEITGEELERILEEAALFLEQRDGRKKADEEELALRQEAGMRRFLRLDLPKAGKAEEYLRELNIGLRAEDLAAAAVFFEEFVLRERVMELLHLFFEEKEERFFCFQSGSQEFFVIFNSSEGPKDDEWGERLCHLLAAHMGSDVYVGLSDVESGYDWISQLCRQAWTAGMNRKFFGISGCRCFKNIKAAGEEKPCGIFGRRLREIWELLEQQDFSPASRKGLEFFNSLKAAEDLHMVYVLALGRMVLAAYLRKFQESVSDEEDNPRLREIILLLGKEYSSFSLFQEEMESALCLICRILNRKFRRNRYSPPVQEIIRFVEEHYGERISLELLADRAHLSRSYVSVLFKRETGQRFSEYLQEVRLKNACHSLKYGNCSIQEVAEMTGFFDTAHFSRVFKEKMGVSPMEYRKKNFRAKKS